MICAGEERHALYRFYDAREELLYVGITDEPWRRWREHVRTKPWYPRVKHQAITWYEDKAAAEAAEREAIRSECPRFNIAGAVRPVAEGAEPELTESVVRDRRRRTLIILLLCTDWAFLPSIPGMPSWHTTVMKVLIASTALPLLVMLAITAAPAISRFGFWLERTFLPRWPERDMEKAT